MKVVAVKQESGKYLFTVPESVELKAGDMVAVKTVRGMQFGVCVCDSFVADDGEKICKLWGTNIDRMQPVVGRHIVEMFEETGGDKNGNDPDHNV